MLLAPLRFEVVLNCFSFSNPPGSQENLFLKESSSKIPSQFCLLQLKYIYNFISFCPGKSAFLCPLSPIPVSLIPLPKHLRAALETNLLPWTHHLWYFLLVSLSYSIKFKFLQNFKCTAFILFISHVISFTFPIVACPFPFVGFSYFKLVLIFVLLSQILSISLNQAIALYLSSDAANILRE